MTRSILCGLLALISVGALGVAPFACQSGGVGDKCTSEDEFKDTFRGFSLSEALTESRSFSCQTRVCLVNHFQGRTTCPYGQETPSDPDSAATECQDQDSMAADRDADAERKKACCVPGMKTRVKTAVCGQCDAEHGRNADSAVYCSCRCCAPCCDKDAGADAGACEPDPELCGDKCLKSNFNFCSCPSGFVCDHVRLRNGPNDQLAGAYCVKEDNRVTSTEGDNSTCGTVAGFVDDPSCKGLAQSGSKKVGDAGAP